MLRVAGHLLLTDALTVLYCPLNRVAAQPRPVQKKNASCTCPGRQHRRLQQCHGVLLLASSAGPSKDKFSALFVPLRLASTATLVCCKNPACSKQLGGSPGTSA